MNFALVPLFHRAVLATIARHFTTDIGIGCHNRGTVAHFRKASSSHLYWAVKGRRALIVVILYLSITHTWPVHWLWLTVKYILGITSGDSIPLHKTAFIHLAATGIVLELEGAIGERNEVADSHVKFAELSKTSGFNLKSRCQGLSYGTAIGKILTNLMKIVLMAVATLSLSKLHTAPSDVSETVVRPL